MGFTLKANGQPFAQHAASIDEAQVRRALMVFLDGDQHYFFQNLPFGNMACFHANQADQIVAWVQQNADGKGLYFGHNPIANIQDRIAKERKGSRVADVTYRRWILVDIDRNKDLEPDNPATENEHEDAGELAFQVLSDLADLGFPAPVQVDSGNGRHLYYRIDLVNDDVSRNLVHDFLIALDKKYSGTKGSIGEECFDSRRIGRLPGSWARRGVASKERPYRQCRIIYTPRDGGIVKPELLRQAIEQCSTGPKIFAPTVADEPEIVTVVPEPESPQREMPTGFILETPQSANRTYCLAALEKECAKLAATKPKGRNNQLFKSAAALYELVGPDGLESFEVGNRLYLTACELGLDQDANCGEEGIRKTIESGKNHGSQKTRRVPEKADSTPRPQEIEANTLIIVRASEITPRKVEWLWPGRIPLGKLTTFAGNGGLGKTMVLTDIAARISNGSPWPDESAGNAPAKVLYVSGEDDPEDTLVPRLIAANGNRENVAYFIPEVLGKFTLADLPALDMALDQLGERCLLVAIDPPTAYLGGINDHKNGELRKLLSPLAGWAAKRRVAVVFITHVTKPQGAKVDAIMRVLGSVAWVNAVRAAHMFATDPDDEARCLFVPMKSNLGRRRKGIAYTVDEVTPGVPDGDAKVTWHGEVDTTANQAVAGETKKKTRSEQAAGWLIERFREKLEWHSDDLFREGATNYISRKAIFEAKDELELPKARRTILPNGTVAWVWWVPADWHRFQDSSGPTSEKPLAQLAHLEEVEL